MADLVALMMTRARFAGSSRGRASFRSSRDRLSLDRGVYVGSQSITSILVAAQLIWDVVES